MSDTTGNTNWTGWCWRFCKTKGRSEWVAVCKGVSLSETASLLEKYRGPTPPHLTLVKGGYAAPSWEPKSGNNSA